MSEGTSDNLNSLSEKLKVPPKKRVLSAEEIVFLLSQTEIFNAVKKTK